jgi:general secretion pathway protein A
MDEQGIAMYGTFYGMQRQPFPLDPEPALYFTGGQFARANNMLDYAVLRQEGIVVITGDAGCGKTMLVRSYLAGAEENLVVGVISNPTLLEESVIHGVMLAFGLNPVASQNATLYAGLHEFLKSHHEAGRGVMLIVDEAQYLSESTLEQLRILTNPEVNSGSSLRLILTGQPRLSKTLDLPVLEQLRQRVVVEIHLEPLSAIETKTYIAHHLFTAGANRPIFSNAALSAVYQGSRGIPRMINLLCDTALLYGYADELSQIDEALVRQVIVDRRLNDGGHPAIRMETPPSLDWAPREQTNALQPQYDDREIARQLFGTLSGRK